MVLAAIINGTAPVSVQAEILEHWTTNQLQSFGYYTTSIAYGNGVWVLSTEFYDGDFCYYSSDGIAWHTANQNGAWGSQMKFENGHFLGVGGYATVFDSTNGINWNNYSLPSAYMGDYTGFGDVTYGNGLYVCVGKTNDYRINQGYIISSTDGTNWTPRLRPTYADNYICGVCYGNGRFVAIGNNDNIVYSSINGISWSRQTIPPGGNEIKFANNLFFIPLLNSNLISTDGLSWTSHSTGSTNSYIHDIKYIHGLYMGSASGYLATSIDGTNWCEYTNSPVWAPFATDGARIATFWNALSGTNVGDFPGYNAYINLSDPLANIETTGNFNQSVALFGLIGRQYQIQSSDSLGAAAIWQTNATFVLSNKVYVWTPPALATNSSKFYRAALLP